MSQSSHKRPPSSRCRDYSDSHKGGHTPHQVLRESVSWQSRSRGFRKVNTNWLEGSQYFIRAGSWLISSTTCIHHGLRQLLFDQQLWRARALVQQETGHPGPHPDLSGTYGLLGLNAALQNPCRLTKLKVSSYICVISRLYVRIKIVQKPGWDDLCVLLYAVSLGGETR